MAITTFDKFLPYVQPYVPECPEFVIEQHIVEAASQFCERTHMWKVDFDEDTTSVGEALYELDIPSGTILEDVNVMYLEGYPIRRIMDEAGVEGLLGKTGQPLYFSISQDQFVRFFPTPDDSYTFTGQAVVKPALNSTGIETFIYNSFGREIAYGAIAELKAIPGKAWSDHMLAANYRMFFNQGVERARIREYRSTPLRVRPRPFA